MKCFTPKQLVPIYSTAGMTAKPGFGICHLRKLCLWNTGGVLAWPLEEVITEISQNTDIYMALWSENLLPL